MAITKYDKKTIGKDIANFIEKIVRKNYKQNKIFLHEPLLDKKDEKALSDVIKTRFVSTVGKKISIFENRIKKFTGSKYVLALNSGTSALHLSLLSLGVKQDEEILISSLSFIASSNAISYCGAKCHYVELMNEGYGIDYIKLKKYLKLNCYVKKNECINRKTKKVIKALIVVHIFGSCNDLDKIFKICKEYNIKIIEDAAEALGSFYKRKHLGTVGNVGIISFNGNKIITTGSGGCIITNNKKIYQKCLSLATTCKVPHKWNFVYSGLGYNYKMNNVQAALGISQLKKINKILNLKKKIFDNYKNSFKNNQYFDFFCPPKYCKSNNWLNSIIIKKKFINYKEDILLNLIKNKIFCRSIWPLMALSPHLRNSKKMNLTNAKKISESVICLPSSPKF